jgi:hypothetical protein
MRAILLLLATLSLPLASALDPIPPNDDRAFALPVAADLRPVQVWEPTSGAGLEAGEPTPCGAMGATVWFAVRPLLLSVVHLDTSGSDYDTVVAAYEGAPSAATLKGCNDDASGSASELTFLAYPGETYYVQAGGHGGASGLLALQVSFWPPGP